MQCFRRGNSQEAKFRAKSLARVEQMLDIRSILQMQLKFRNYLKIVLKPHQRELLNAQRANISELEEMGQD